MELIHKQIRRPVEQNRRPKYESLQLHPPDSWQSLQKDTMEKRQLLQQMLLEKLALCLQRTETRSMSLTLYKYQLKED
jgi:hypothetical protein